MQGNPVALSLFLMCGVPILLVAFGFWLGRGAPLPGGIHIAVIRGRTSYDDEQ